MVIDRDVLAFNEVVAVEFHLFTGDTASVGHGFSHGVTSEGKGEHFFERLALVLHGSVEDVLSEFHEVSVLCHEVSFTFQGDDGGEAVGGLHEHSTFCCFSVRTLGCHSLTFFADDFDGFFHVAVSFGQSLFAVAQTGAGHGAEFLDIF